MQLMSDAEAVVLPDCDWRAHPARPQAATKANISTSLDLEFSNWYTPLAFWLIEARGVQNQVCGFPRLDQFVS